MGKGDSSIWLGKRWWFGVSLVAAGVSVVVASVLLLRDLVERRFALPPTTPRVVLIDQPAWMSQALAEQIIDTARPVGVHSVFDQQLLKDTAEALEKSPWIKQVRQVRRAYIHWPGDTLQVDCVYRVPTALVKWQDGYWLVDGDGCKLPAEYTPAQVQRAMLDPNGKLTLRVIQGVTRPPSRAGKPWPGDDLAAGLELAKLLAGKPFANEVPVVDVSNVNGRRDRQAAQIVLVTKYGTQIRWGRPPSAKDYFVEVPTSQKLQCLADIYQQMHRVDGGQSWIDVRFDQVTYPSPQPAANQEKSGDDAAVTANAN
jgi:hypothetical protein